MFNSLLSMYAFFALFICRHLIKRKLSIFLYHIILFCILFVAAVGGGSVQNDAYDRLEKFIELEKNHKLQDKKQNRHNDDPMLAIDLQAFESSEEFRAYLKENDAAVHKAEGIFLGWLLVLISDLAMICIYIFQCIRYRISKMSRS
jgi:hypothetical protein